MLQTGRVVGGKIVFEDDDEPLPEGAMVTVVVPNNDGRWDITPAQEGELADRIRAADRGELVESNELWSLLGQKG